MSRICCSSAKRRLRICAAQNDIYEADTRLNKEDGWDWMAEITSSCSGRYDVEGVMTRERDHHFGMNESESVCTRTRL